MTALAIEVENITCRYGDTLALDSVSLSVPRGTNFALLGPNGAGKTTLVNILSTLQRAGSGRALVGGVDVRRAPTAARRNIGVVFQDSSLDTRLSVWENLEFHGLVYGMDKRDRRGRIDEVLHLVELQDWDDTSVRSLSGGMKRRLEIARALLHRPQILFLDEPTVGLDAQTRQRIWQYLAQLRQEQNITVLTTTHYIEEVESCDQVCIIDHGKILADGAPHALKAAYGKSWLHVMPRDEAARQAILAHEPDAPVLSDGWLAIAADDPTQVDVFMAGFGSRLRETRLEEPTLESVFLSLTGRQLRDRVRDGAAVAQHTERDGQRS